MEHSNRVVTPEAVALELRTANVGSRILAYLVDFLVLAGIALLLIGIIVAAVSATDLVIPETVAVVLVLIGIPLWLFGYPIAMETLWRGRTLGKAALGLRVVTTEGMPIGFRHAAVRALLGVVDFQLCSGFVAVVMIISTRSNQRLGDMVAGTLVLRERSGARLPEPTRFEPPPGLERYVAALDVTGLSSDEYQTVRSFLLRARSLQPGPRTTLALQLADPLATRTRPAPPSTIPPEVFLHCVAAAYQRRQAQAQGQAQPATTGPASTWTGPAAWRAPEAPGQDDRPGEFRPPG